MVWIGSFCIVCAIISIPVVVAIAGAFCNSEKDECEGTDNDDYYLNGLIIGEERVKM